MMTHAVLNQASRTSTRKFSARRPVLAVALMLALAGTGAPTAWAEDPASVGLRWDGPTTNLDWRGNGYATVDGTFIGAVVAVPGDQAERTAIVRNDGPGAARAHVDITAVTTNAADTVNTELASLVTLRWKVNGQLGSSTWKDAPVGDPVYSTTFPIERGAEFPITIGYLFPFEATGGKAADGTSSELSFTVRVTLEGEIPPPAQAPTAHTGGSVVSPQSGFAAAGLAAVGLTIAAVLVARRARRDTPLTVPQRKELP